jgi:hypothetical protein
MKKFINIFISAKIWIKYLCEEIRLYFSLILIQYYKLMIYFIITLYLNALNYIHSLNKVNCKLLIAEIYKI